MGDRRLPDFIRGFEQYAQAFNTPPLYVKYGALWMLGTAATRAVGTRAGGNDIFPNLYVGMVGGPGTGKSQLVKGVKRILLPATSMSLIPPSVTRAGLQDYMTANIQQRSLASGEPIFANECIGISDEMQGILPDQDLGHLTFYNELYDLPPTYRAVTRTHGELKLEFPYCSILTGAQPAFLATTMPEQAWGMGFMSRMMLVFSQPKERRSVFDHAEVDMALQAALVHDLKQVFNLRGWMHWTAEAKNLYETWWVEEGGQPIPQAKRLAMGYNARRQFHMLKLAMILSLSRSNDLIVTLEDVGGAIELLLLTEDKMKMIFNEMAVTGSMVAIEDAVDLVRTKTAAGEHCDEAQLIEVLMQRMPSNQVHSIIENLLASRMIESVGGLDIKGFRKFKATAKAGSMLQ